MRIRFAFAGLALIAGMAIARDVTLTQAWNNFPVGTKFTVLTVYETMLGCQRGPRFYITVPRMVTDFDGSKAAVSTPTVQADLKKRAEQGDGAAQTNLGFMFANGDGVPRDMTEAEKWYRKAAVKGIVEAQVSLGFIFARGDGVPRDMTEAAKWYRKAAEQGDAKAQFIFGAMCEEAAGVPSDMAEAAKWRREAARQGLVQAQAQIGAMYFAGKGVQRDFVEGLAWCNVAIASGSTDFNPIVEKMKSLVSLEVILAAQQRSYQILKEIKVAKRAGPAGQTRYEPAR